MTKDSSHLMIEIGNKTSVPIEVWEQWPLGRLQKGDILRVSWWYNGVHGPVSSEDHYLLLNCTEKSEEKEVWSTLIFDETTNGEKRPGGFRQHTITSSDFGTVDGSDWQKIALIARAE